MPDPRPEDFDLPTSVQVAVGLLMLLLVGSASYLLWLFVLAPIIQGIQNLEGE